MSCKIVVGDLLDATEDAIMQQCNCVTITPKGLSKAIFNKWPYANDYTNRTLESRPSGGTISIKRPGDDEDGKIIVNMFAQYYPSSANFSNDSTNIRLRWFKQCLFEIENQLINTNEIRSIAFPYKIGCGLAGGDWTKYKLLMDNFAVKNPNIDVVMYKLPNEGDE